MSIVTQTVTVRHPADLSRAAIHDAIEEAGFDIISEPDDNDLPHAQSTPLASLSLSHNLARLGTSFSPKKERHLAQCAACQAEQRASLERGAEPSASFHEEKLSFVLGGEIYLPSQQKAEMPPPTPEEPERSTAASAVSDDHSRQQVTLSIGGMTCASCSNAVTHALSELPGVSDVVVNLLGNSATLTVERADLVPTVTETVEDIGYEAEVISVEPLLVPANPKPARVTEPQGPHRLTLSVGGMTCAACSNTVTDVLEGVPGVLDPIVNLLGASATMVVQSRDIIPQVVEAIEDAGYEAEVNSTEPIKPEKDEGQEVGPRTVTLRVDGLFCRFVHFLLSISITHASVVTVQGRLWTLFRLSGTRSPFSSPSLNTVILSCAFPTSRLRPLSPYDISSTASPALLHRMGSLSLQQFIILPRSRIEPGACSSASKDIFLNA